MKQAEIKLTFNEWQVERNKPLVAMKAAAPLKPKKPQEFDLGALPLFGDQSKQKEMF